MVFLVATDGYKTVDLEGGLPSSLGIKFDSRQKTFEPFHLTQWIPKETLNPQPSDPFTLDNLTPKTDCSI